jgi:hypothetical protein
MNCPLYPTETQMPGTDWTLAYKCSIWDGKGNCGTFERPYVHEPEDANKVRIKIARNRLADSAVPDDPQGWELFASMDADCDITHGQATISDTDDAGTHRIMTIPDGVPKILTP